MNYVVASLAVVGACEIAWTTCRVLAALVRISVAHLRPPVPGKKEI